MMPLDNVVLGAPIIKYWYLDSILIKYMPYESWFTIANIQKIVAQNIRANLHYAKWWVRRKCEPAQIQNIIATTQRFKSLIPIFHGFCKQGLAILYKM